MLELLAQGYLAEPHMPAYEGLQRDSEPRNRYFSRHGSSAKFKESVENVINQEIEMPEALAEALQKPCLAEPLSAIYWR